METQQETSGDGESVHAEIAEKDLNWREARVLKALRERAKQFRRDEAVPSDMKIRELTRKCFPGVRPVTKADSQVRNALRRLVRHGFVTYVGTVSDPGRYEIASRD